MITVTLSKVLDESWGTPEELSELSDEQIIELISEDYTEFVVGAKISVARTEGGRDARHP